MKLSSEGVRANNKMPLQATKVRRASRRLADSIVPGRSLCLLAWIVAVSLAAATVLHAQREPPPDPELDAARVEMDRNEQSIKVRPQDPKAKKAEIDTAIKFSLAERDSHRMEAALWLLLRARYWVPDDPELLFDLAIQEENLKLFVDADLTLTEAQRLRPNDEKTLYAVARVKMDLGQMQSAEQAWLAYIRYYPDNPSAYYGYGVVLQTLQKDDEARVQFADSIRLDSKQAESYYRIGEIDRRDGNFDDAKKHYQEALLRDSSHGGALTGLAILDYQQKSYLQAEKELELAIKYMPNYRTARYYHGLVLAKLGKLTESRAELAVAMRLAQNTDQQRRLIPKPYLPH